MHASTTTSLRLIRNPGARQFYEIDQKELEKLVVKRRLLAEFCQVLVYQVEPAVKFESDAIHLM